ncbi:hypothetical protein TELCIR_14212 [Teladorsagia circumcincta]|uniref:Uncharacterized protein n=1 Tax=Teladorsagia circumcincta TaxID=45464 RepID=A0A2G9U1M4_TELCI|nr:hypothetical protein TELCIR_14212 [Teladorsagia circumcincta]
MYGVRRSETETCRSAKEKSSTLPSSMRSSHSKSSSTASDSPHSHIVAHLTTSRRSKSMEMLRFTPSPSMMRQEFESCLNIMYLYDLNRLPNKMCILIIKFFSIVLIIRENTYWSSEMTIILEMLFGLIFDNRSANSAFKAVRHRTNRLLEPLQQCHVKSSTKRSEKGLFQAGNEGELALIATTLEKLLPYSFGKIA